MREKFKKPSYSKTIGELFFCAHPVEIDKVIIDHHSHPSSESTYSFAQVGFSPIGVGCCDDLCPLGIMFSWSLLAISSLELKEKLEKLD